MQRRSFLALTSVLMLALAGLACSLFDGSTTSQNGEPVQPGSGASSAPSGSSQAGLGEQQRSEEGGFAFRSVSGYSLDSAFGFVTMQAPDADPDVGPVIVLIGAPSQESQSLDQLYENFTKDLASNVQISNSRNISIGGASGMSADISGTGKSGQELAGRIVIAAVSPTQQFSMIGSAPKDRWQNETGPLFEQVLDSVSFFEPSQSTLEIPDLPATTPPPAPVPQVEGGQIRQWASSATASTEYGSPEWAASQASGAPDTPDCSDSPTAWAAAESNTVDWIELGYDVPVIPSQVNIVQSYSPSQVSQVELIDEAGSYHKIYNEAPLLMDTCPFTLSLPVHGVNFPVKGVRVTIDQSVIEVSSWNEIDAVELVGSPTAP